jgi:hypothetical protein
MAGLADFRAKHPEYNDMSDGALSDALYRKFYSDMPRADFDAKMGSVAQQPDPSALANLPASDLPTPGNPNFDPSRPQTPNYAFGTSRGATLNPLPAIATMGNEIAANVPIAGPYLKQTGEKLDAYLGGTTPEAVAAGNAEMARQNPAAATTGKVVGAVAPYALASGVPVLNQALGFSGPMLQRLLMTGASQFGINTGDNMAHGQPIEEAAGNAVMPSLLATPTAMFGPSGAKMTPTRAAALDVMKKEGVPLTGGQATMSKKTMMAESQLGGRAAQAFQEKQLKAFTKAALKSAGVAADSADPDVLRKAYEVAGDKFSNLAAITQPRITANTHRDLLSVADEYVQAKGVNAAPVLETIIDRIGTMAARNGGTLKGEQYKTIVTDIRKYAEGSSDIELKTALGELREVLDDAVEKSMGGQTLAAWQKVRAQYRNLITVTEAVAGGGEMALQGIIDPVSLNNAVRANVGRRNYAKGYGDLNELSRAGRLVMPKLPDSGTATRTAAMGSGMLGTPAGIISYFASGGDIKAGLGAAAAMTGAAAVPWLTGRAMLSGPGRAAIASGGTKVPATMARGLLPILLGQ